jgi:hypothetical protein
MRSVAAVVVADEDTGAATHEAVQAASAMVLRAMVRMVWCPCVDAGVGCGWR